jgi:hypothetical protein
MFYLIFFVGLAPLQLLYQVFRDFLPSSNLEKNQNPFIIRWSSTYNCLFFLAQTHTQPEFGSRLVSTILDVLA